MGLIERNWFKVVITVFGVLTLIFLNSYPERLSFSGKQVEAYRVCLDSLTDEVLSSGAALRMNMKLCDEMSDELEQPLFMEN